MIRGIPKKLFFFAAFFSTAFFSAAFLSFAALLSLSSAARSVVQILEIDRTF